MMKVINVGEKNIDDIRNRRVYIYGAGEYAHDVCVALAKYEITVDGYIVDDEFFANKEGTIAYGQFSESQDVIVVNGIANVETFKRNIDSNKFSKIYITFGLTKIWNYDKLYFNNQNEKISEILEMFNDDQSRLTYKNYLHCIEHDEIDSFIETAESSDIYFNSISCNMDDGAFVDCGAFNGDTINKFLAFIKRTRQKSFDGEIFAFEPDKDNYSQLTKNFTDNKKIYCIDKGTWDNKGFIQFTMNNGMASCFLENSDAGNAVEVTDIDSVVGKTKISFIKLDVEGAEYKTLVGARTCIERDHPILAISAYHKMEDLVELPYLVKSFENQECGYQLYLRHHGVCPMELVLYGIPYKK